METKTKILIGIGIGILAIMCLMSQLVTAQNIIITKNGPVPAIKVLS
ncbi:MAG: hypothetical protein GW779_05845 [Candidatus Altiarchaeum hamiconexum]|uniref:Uncharacterized protein n=1 Tax=Candidatus Altarchaeum hamiconexum TaxID=1803513 RepID=A0A8J7Z4L2_9ARCH|nr:hypothetical protein [Candidatus Altarchaeum hamiconexum]NCN69007.1 hypothetical protein [Candidatus Altarchaeum hamiconexum]NCS91905.1 hypothetical protein [Candidatus Altarchaeum hamiconexum]NCT00531.1 hypothetical protein [Candidatus Altarchaeum hamiconexum]